MALTKFNANSHIRSFERTRDAWLEVLVKNPDNNEAAFHILTCNEKLNLLRILRGSTDD